MESNKKKIVIEVGDIIDLCFKPFGDIEPYIVEKIGHREQGEFSPNNSFYVRVRKVEEKDCKNIVIKEQDKSNRSYHLKSSERQKLEKIA